MDPIAALDTLPPWQAAGVVLAVSLGGAAFAQFVVRAARRLVARTETAFDEILVDEFAVPVVLTLALCGVFVLTRLEGVVAAVPVTPVALEAFFERPALTLVVLAWAWALNQVVNRGVDRLSEAGARYDFAPVFSNVWTLTVLVGTVATALYVWRVDVTPPLAGAGIAGIAVGFAAKDTVANFFGGIALYVDDTYRVGDYVELDSGEAGTVVTVGVRSTTLRTRDEVSVTVPNSLLNAGKVINQSAPGRRRRIRVPVGVAHGTGLDAFEAIALAAAAAESLALDSPAPRMRLRAFGDSALNYELLCWVASPTRAAKATHRLNRAIYAGVTEAGIEIPYPKRDLTVRAADGSGRATALGPAMDAADAADADDAGTAPDHGPTGADAVGADRGGDAARRSGPADPDG